MDTTIIVALINGVFAIIVALINSGSGSVSQQNPRQPPRSAPPQQTQPTVRRLSFATVVALVFGPLELATALYLHSSTGLILGTSLITLVGLVRAFVYKI
jgi:hypothetical protein